MQGKAPPAPVNAGRFPIGDLLFPTVTLPCFPTPVNVGGSAYRASRPQLTTNLISLLHAMQDCTT